MKQSGKHSGLTLAAVMLAATPASATITIVETGQGVVSLSSNGTGAAELSGITFAGGDIYYAVGDDGAKTIWQLGIPVDHGTGWISSALVTGSVAAPGLGSDSEGIALTPGGMSVWVADEVASTITEFSLATGAIVGSIPLPPIYAPANVQQNRGLESLTFGAAAVWTANEEALVPDGPLASTTAGSWVRLQRFAGDDLGPAGQWAYLTDPLSATSQFTTATRNGLVDLVALSDGGLLALERNFGGAIPTFRSRIYAVDFTAASDVSDLASLAGGGFTAAGKTLLWEGSFASSNFEGLTLGPLLDDGGRSLILISDDGAGAGGQQQNLLGLVVYVVPEPSTIGLAVLGCTVAWLAHQPARRRYHRVTSLR
jgi:hypothetical protein